MRHDYNLPADWETKTPKEKSRWMTQDRACRQALRQETPTGRMLRSRLERVSRRGKARSETVDVRR